MKHTSLVSFLLLFFIFSCTTSPEKQAQEVIEKSIEAHQLSKKWEDVAAIRFKKLTRLLNEDGSVKSESEQWVEFRLKPYFEAKLTWSKDSIAHVVHFNGSKTSYQMGQNSIQNEGFLKAKRAEIDGAYFAFGQPWMLANEQANLVYEGQKTLGKGDSAQSIRIETGLESESKRLYFDPISGKLIALEQHTKGQNELIEIISYQEASGLLLTKEQKSLKLDGKGNTQFLQAEYFYSDYQVTFE